MTETFEFEPPDSSEQLDVALAAAVYVEHNAELSRFLYGVLKDSHLVSDVLQTAFTRLVEKGGNTNEESRKSWLFRVAFNEAMATKRRIAAGEKAARKKQAALPHSVAASDHPILRNESIQLVRQAINELSPQQQTVVRLRIYEEKPFHEIAAELDISVSAAIGRMHSAMKILRSRLANESP